MHMRYLIMLPLCLAAAACSSGEDSSAAKGEAATPATMAPGQYATDMEVKTFRSTDGTPPAVKAAVGDKSAGAGCVAAGSPPPAELFAGPDNKCTYKNSYIKEGLINASLDCTAKGVTGQVMYNVQGSYTATGFDVTVDTTTYLPGAGDFAMSRSVKGRLTGPTCAPAPAEGADGNMAAGNSAKGS
jgi:hypothetical protein